MTSGLSHRGRGMVEGGLSPYIRAHFERQADPGYVGLCVAENHQVFPMLQDRLERIPPVTARLVGYDEMAGGLPFRRAIARLFEDHLLHRPLDPDHVQVLAGAGGVLDALGHALGDPGDGVLVPTPSYSGFWPDLEIRPGLRLIPVPTSPDEGFRLTPERLQQAWEAAEVPIRILLLTNPDNPRGQVMSTVDLEAVLAWAEGTGVHVVADEIYALSATRGFTSVGQLRPVLGDRLHIVWAFSKDFGMSGLRCGVLITEDQDLRQAIELQGSWQGVSSHTQHVLTGMLEDEVWRDGFISSMREGLASTAAEVGAALDAAAIVHVPPTAGFFVLCDLRRWLQEPTWAAEHDLWSHLLEQTGVNLTPGSALRSPEPGWFRLCYASNPPEVVVDAIDRMGRALGTIRGA